MMEIENRIVGRGRGVEHVSSDPHVYRSVHVFGRVVVNIYAALLNYSKDFTVGYTGRRTVNAIISPKYCFPRR